MRPRREFFAYDCPVQGIDFDVEPLPAYGSMIRCSACDGQHRADETLGTAHRVEEPDGTGKILDITDEWSGRCP